MHAQFFGTETETQCCTTRCANTVSILFNESLAILNIPTPIFMHRGVLGIDVSDRLVLRCFHLAKNVTVLVSCLSSSGWQMGVSLVTRGCRMVSKKNLNHWIIPLLKPRKGDTILGTIGASHLLMSYLLHNYSAKVVLSWVWYLRVVFCWVAWDQCKSGVSHFSSQPPPSLIPSPWVPLSSQWLQVFPSVEFPLPVGFEQILFSGTLRSGIFTGTTSGFTSNRSVSARHPSSPLNTSLFESKKYCASFSSFGNSPVARSTGFPAWYPPLSATWNSWMFSVFTVSKPRIWLAAHPNSATGAWLTTINLNCSSKNWMSAYWTYPVLQESWTIFLSGEKERL